MDRNLELLRTAWSGGALPGGDRLYPSSPDAGRPHLAGDLHGGRRAPRRRGRRRADAVAHPAAPARRAQGLAGRHPEPDDRRLSRGAAQGPRAAHPGLAHGVRRRRPQGGDAAGRDRSARRMRHRLAATGNLVVGQPGRRPDRGVRRPYRHAGRGDRLAAGRQHAGARHRPHRAGPFDRSAASLHPALDRAGRRAGGAGARLGAADKAGERRVA